MMSIDLLLQSLNDTDVLFLTIWGEARGERIEGQVAVGCTIRNRVHSEDRTYKDICLAAKQFSCWNSNDPNYPMLIELAERLVSGEKISDPRYRQVMLIAEGVISWAIQDITRGSMNYVTKDLWQTARPYWARNAKNVQEIGSQVFFNA